METYSLGGEKVILVSYMERHVPKYHQWMQDPYLLQATGSEPLTLDEEYEMHRSWTQDPQSTHLLCWISNLWLVILQTVVLMLKSWQGLGKEVVLLMMSFAINKFHIQSFRAKIGDSNLSSLNLFKKLGFKEVSYSEALKR
ncbi:hypothetical protein GIB67_037353 [Kingdonia uniflora]|uniref:N-acetyltransferase domain-containing protein n=1 Tax=Kingdonia uniflora TaxID=39325 RepID=A0A7J7NVS2_9MAGN|nr:hypothetical protein GIB67_037353 [Kingdonia uniflora]